MNQPHSIYRTDYGPHPWFENNFTSNITEFCSPDNIDDCLKYISQEFSALGYSSIYTSPNSCPYAVNCDIVKLLNTIYEFLHNFRELNETKEDLENRNQRLLTDLNALTKKNAQLKECLEKSERKYNSVLERERQLKGKTEQLQQSLKNEKDESKKLSSQIQNQKVVYQHEIRKYESRLNQMKSRLNQILADKNPDKKVANISTAHLLQRSTNQRGKWKTGTSAKSSTEDMYMSIISSHENNFQVVVKEIEDYRICLVDIEHQILEIISLFEGDSCTESFPHLYTVWNGENIQKCLRERFSTMLSKVKNNVLQNVSRGKFEDDIQILKQKLLKYENSLEKNESSSQIDGNIETIRENTNNESLRLQKSENICSCNKKVNMNEEKAALSTMLAQIKQEQSKLESKKLEMIKLVMKQKSTYPSGSKSVSSFSIMTTKNGLTAVPYAHQLKQCLSYPDQLVKLVSPLWEPDAMRESTFSISSPTFICNESERISFTESPGANMENSDLPKWACSASNIFSETELGNLESPLLQCNDNIQLTNSASNEDAEVTEINSSEEDDLAKLRAAIKDIEKRQQNLSK